MSDEPLTRDEQRQLFTSAGRVHLTRNLGGAFPIGDYIVDWYQAAHGPGRELARVWVYYNHRCVYSSTAHGSKTAHEWGHARQVLDLLVAETLLDDLANI